MKKYIITRIITFFVVLSLVVSYIPTLPANAATDTYTYPYTYTGLAGVPGSTNVTWTLNVTDYENPYGYKDAYLDLSGTGRIDYPFEYLATEHRVNIRTVDIEYGATVIGEGAFFGLLNCRGVNIPNSVVSIERNAFKECFGGALDHDIVIPSSVTTIGEEAFAHNPTLHNVYIDSPTVAKNLNSKHDCGCLVDYADTIFINDSINAVGSYITDNFVITGTKELNGKTYNIYKEPCEHAFGGYYSDQLYHWLICVKCGKLSYEEHWGYVEDNDYHICITCDEKLNHVWEDDITAEDSWNHGIACKYCNAFNNSEKHIYDNDCDTTCETCGYIRTITHKYFPDYESDNSYHWYECEVCGDRQEHNEHVWEDNCDTVCDICGYLRTVSHSYTTKWSNNNNEHWHFCEICNKKIDVAEHEYDGNICVVCNYDNTEGSFYAGTGTELDPYIIKDISNLMYFAKSLNEKTSYRGQYIKLVDDIALNDETFTFLADSGLVKVTDGTNTAYLGTGILGATGGGDTFDTVPSAVGVWYESENSLTTCEYGGTLNEWSPLGENGKYRFAGTFIGSGHTISGLYINTTNDNVGLFAEIGSYYNISPDISGICIKNSYIRGNDNVGSIVGDGYPSAEIRNCYSNATVCGNDDVSGIAGTAASVSDCRNEGTISGKRNVGGITSFCCTVSGCYNSGNIYGENGKAAGVAVSARTVSDCGNVGKVTAGSGYVGAAGIVCNPRFFSDVPQITNCMNSGDVSGAYYVGGIVGYLDHNDISIYISDCYNFGTVTGQDSVAGIIARSEGLVQIERCANEGAISGQEYIGGVSGYLYSSSEDSYIMQSYNKGGVTSSKACAGGIVSFVYQCKISDCYNTGAITGRTGAGGICGYGNYGTYISTCYSSGVVCTTGLYFAAGGIAASVPYPAGSHVEKCYYLQGNVTACTEYPSSKRTAYGIGGKESDVEGVTTALDSYYMKKHTSYVGFDFYLIWDSTTTYPTLRAIYHQYHGQTLNTKSNEHEHWWSCSCGLRSDIEKHTYDNACDTACDCGYVREIVHDFSDDWTCYDDSVHAQSCSVCGEVRYSIAHDYTNACDSTCNTCGYSRTPPHSFSNQYSQNELTHWLKCSLCELTKELGSHEYTNECDTSCNVCSYERVITHNFSKWMDYDTSAHWHTCLLCDTTSIKTAHIFDDACDEKCNECNYTREITHTYESEWTSDETHHWHKCSVCGDKKDVAEHIYDNDCDITCNVCGYIRTITHSYKTEWTNDASQHWHECSVCGDKIDAAEHVYDNACDTTCNVCGYTREITHSYQTEWTNDTSYHWHECSVCGDKIDADEHVYDNACDTTCNICGYTRKITHSYQTEWTNDASQHWHECSVCGDKIDADEHVFDNACDTTCNVCGYTREITHSYKTEWTNDASQHWHECSVCGDKIDAAGHVFDNACDTTCNICGYTREITHNYQTEWTNDASQHWHECSVCGDKIDTAEHIYGDTGSGTCIDCGYKAFIVGDLDGTETIDKDDAIYLLMHSFFPEIYPVYQECDYDGNGNVDKDDAVYLLMYTFFPDYYPLLTQSVQ